jgi:hypothetical protein
VTNFGDFKEKYCYGKFFSKMGFCDRTFLSFKINSQNGENSAPMREREMKNKNKIIIIIIIMRQYIRNEGQNFCNNQKGFAQI